MAKGDVTVNIRGEYDDRQVGEAIRDMKRLSGAASRTGKGFGGIGVGGAAIAGGLAVAGAAAISFGQDAVAAAQESQIADQRLTQIATQMGLVDGAYAGGVDRLNQYAQALQTQIGVEDESISAVQSKLIVFGDLGKTINDTGGAMDRATLAAFDLASAGFGTAETNAKALGKALADPIGGMGGLSRLGVKLTDEQKALVKGFMDSGDKASAMGVILGAVEGKVGGVAEKTKTAGQDMSVAFGQLQENVGMAILPALQSLAEALLPIFDQIKGPIEQIAGTLGTYLADFITALMPILPPLADALAQVGIVLAQVFGGAIQALMPVITPLLELIADLATRLMPLLGPLLMKMGEALGAVMNAVVPLLEPLLNLVFDILEPLMPIIDVILDVFIEIVNNALAPLLDVVGLLLEPLGTLINVLLAAVLPIIEPLIPLFSGLASVLGGVVVGAIGLLMVGFGKMLSGLVGAAPWIISNVIKPIANAFVTWAEGIVNTAEFAFSWVPLIGEKITAAKNAMVGLKATVMAGIDSVGAAASGAGATIANQLISGGEQALASAGSLMGQAGSTFVSMFSGKPKPGASGRYGNAIPQYKSTSTAKMPGLATGGPANYGNAFFVGERGPELFIPDVSGTIIPNNKLGMAGGGGSTYNITVQAGVGDPREIGRQVVESIKSFERVSGPVFVAA